MAEARLARVTALARADAWWEHKLAPIAGTAYATALYADTPLVDVAGSLALALVAVVLGAIYVSVLNDLTDLDLDRRVGKPNRLADRPAWAGPSIIAVTAVGGFGITAAAWNDSPVVLALYAGGWLSFAAYSVPPLRLKARGLAGVLADAAGAHFFPFLFVVMAVLTAAGGSNGLLWPVIVGLWTAALGVRSVLVHQFRDLKADTRAGLASFPRQHPRGAYITGAYIAFPVEVAALGGLIALSGSWIAAAALAAYALLAWRKSIGSNSRLAIVVLGDGYGLAVHWYYTSLFPLAMLATACVADPRDLVVLAAHLLLFPHTLIDLFRRSFGFAGRARRVLARW
jgi:4-hydroxybenzoate polyprenyltransferase